MQLIGRSLGKYRLLSVIGSGGMAVVYRAFDADRGRHVALKVLTPTGDDDPRAVGRRFAREGKLIASLRHPHILRVHAYEERDGERFIAMPLAEGGALSERISAGPVSISQALRWIREIAAALDHAHGRGIVHRDLKPGNVLLDRHGVCQLTDFGIAKQSWSDTRLTRTGAVFGTPLYMSPEQAMGEEVDLRSDVYSLGVLAFELLTGGPPFLAESPAALGLKHVCEPVPAASARNPRLGRSVERCLERALAKQRGTRYRTAGEFAAALRASFRHREGITARLAEMETLPPPTRRRSQVRTRRSRALASVIPGGVLLVILAAGIGVAEGSGAVKGLRTASVAPGDVHDGTAGPGDGAPPLRTAEALDPGAEAARREALRDAQLTRAWEAVGRGRLEEGRVALRAALEIAPEDVYARQRLAALERRIEAERLTSEIAARAPDPRMVAALERAERMEQAAHAARHEAARERAARESAEQEARRERELLLAQLEQMQETRRGPAISAGRGTTSARAGGRRGPGGGRGR